MSSRTAMISGALSAWRSVVLDFEGTRLTEAPAVFRDYRLDVRFEHDATGAAIVAPGFFAADGAAAGSGAAEGPVWRVRFRAPTAGVWRWRARFRAGPDIAVENSAAVDFGGAPAGAFDGASGAIRVGPQNATPPDLGARGAAALRGGSLAFAQSGAAAPAVLWNGAGLLHQPEFDGLEANAADPALLRPDAWRPGDPIWGVDAEATSDGVARGRGPSGAVRQAVGQGATVLRLSPVLLDGARIASGPWRDPSRAEPEARAVFDVSRLEQWTLVAQMAERLGAAILLAPGGIDAMGRAAPLSSLGLGRVERRLLLRELTARFGHLNGLIWEADAGLFGEERDFLIELDPMRAQAGPEEAAAAASSAAPRPPLDAAPEPSAGDSSAADVDAEQPPAQDPPTENPPAENPLTENPPTKEPLTEKAPPARSRFRRGDKGRSPVAERSFSSVDDVDRHLGGTRAIRLGALSARALEALLNAAQPSGSRRSRAKPSAGEAKPDARSEASADAPGTDDGGADAETEAAGASSAVSEADRAADRSPASKDVDAEERKPRQDDRASKPKTPARREYVGETEHFDEIDEALAELRKAQGVVAEPSGGGRSGGVRAARRAAEPVAPADPRKSGEGAGDPAADAERRRSGAPEGARRRPGPAPGATRTAIAGIGDASSEPRSVFREDRADPSARKAEPGDAPPPAAATEAGAERDRAGRQRRKPSLPIAGPSYIVSAARRGPATQEGAAAIAMSLYVMDGSDASASADPLSLTAPVDLSALAEGGAALVARFAGSDGSSALSARLSLYNGDAALARTEPIDPFALFTGLDALAGAAAERGADDAYLEVAVFARRDGSGEPLKIWRIPVAGPPKEPEAAPPPPTKDQLAAEALSATAHLVRIDLIDPTADRVVASFGPAGFEAPIEAAGRVLNLKAVIGGRAVSALRARLFVPTAARCAHPFDRPTRIGAEATCHFYGCVFAPGRQEIELVALEDGAALERLMDAPEADIDGVLLRSRVRMSLC